MPNAQLALPLSSPKRPNLIRISEKALDKALAAIREAKKIYEVGGWKVGKLLLELRDSKLWKARLDKLGNPRYESFEQVIVAEVGYSSPRGYDLMKIARAYAAADIARIGSTRARQILKVAPEGRPALIERAKAGESVRRISDAIRDWKIRNGTYEVSSAVKAGEASAKARAKTRAKEKASKSNSEKRTAWKVVDEMIAAIEEGRIDRALAIGKKARRSNGTPSSSA